MKILTYSYVDSEQLNMFLTSSEVCGEAAQSASILAMIFSSENNHQLLESISTMISGRLPGAAVVGSTTVGEISEGVLHLNTILITISFFETARLSVCIRRCGEGEEYAAGRGLAEDIRRSGEDIAGVLLLGTPITLNLSALFTAISADEFKCPFFGGGAGFYDPSNAAGIFANTVFLSRGAIAVVFLSRDLHIFALTHLGWCPLSREMTITESDGIIVQKIDDMPAYDVYKKYLNIDNDSYFFQNVLEYPLLFERDGATVARVPFFTHEDRSVGFVADVVEGEKVRIGYGDPAEIVKKAHDMQKRMFEFQPQAIYIFACICRRFLMQNDVNLETYPFEMIAPTAGFYTYGEFINNVSKVNVLNSTIVVVGLREGESRVTDRPPGRQDNLPDSAFTTDPYSKKHNRIVSQLLHFIGALTKELEMSNAELTMLSQMDKLTQIFNRMKLDIVLDQEIKRAQSTEFDLAVIMLDIDGFKKVNDDYGHLTGDQVLISLAGILKSCIRKLDFVGRWGGEEFLIILPTMGVTGAVELAERIRQQVQDFEFSEAQHITCSLGVTCYRTGDSRETLIKRADQALYRAKNSGKNRTVLFE